VPNSILEPLRRPRESEAPAEPAATSPQDFGPAGAPTIAVSRLNPAPNRANSTELEGVPHILNKLFLNNILRQFYSADPA
jgi:hypothetical protein